MDAENQNKIQGKHRNETYASMDATDLAYPRALKYIPSPPQRLYYLGDAGVLSMPCIAIVGARKATDYGKWVALNLARRLSDRGVVVVSGMAEGIDSFAHRGALEGASPTVAVMGNGLDICFPRGNAVLRGRIAQKGLLLSEYSTGMHGTKFTFPARNRIISGLSLATVVVEAGLSSGSLITAEHAAGQGKEVYAVPGNINRRMSVGCNKLIKDGARPLVFFDDILDDLKLRRSIRILSPGRSGFRELYSANLDRADSLEFRVPYMDGSGVGEPYTSHPGGADPVELRTENPDRADTTGSYPTNLDGTGFVGVNQGEMIPCDFLESQASKQLGEDETLVLACALKHGEITIDDVATLTKLSVPVATCAVTLLEMKGYVHYDHGMIGVCAI